MIKVTFTIWFIFISVFLFGQGNISTENKLEICAIKDCRLKEMLSLYIESEKKCEYYTPELKFIFSFLNENSIQIASFGKKIFQSDRNLCCFEYQEHLFVVTGDSLKYGIFAKTGKYIHNIFTKSQSGEFDEKGRMIFDRDVIQWNDLSIWEFEYKKGRFWLDSIWIPCEEAYEEEFLRKQIDMIYNEIEKKEIHQIKRKFCD